MSESERLKRVYAEYDASNDIQDRRNMTNRGNHQIQQEQKTQFRQSIAQHYGIIQKEDMILDVGCGSGNNLASLIPLGADPSNLYGIDLLPQRIETAKRNHPAINFEIGNAERLQFPDNTFDLLLICTVFSSILDREMTVNLAREVDRVLRPSGSILWYDFRYKNPKNSHTRPMLKNEIAQLFPKYVINLKSTTLLPPLARRLGQLTTLLYPVLSLIPLLRTHYVGLLQKPDR